MTVDCNKKKIIVYLLRKPGGNGGLTVNTLDSKVDPRGRIGTERAAPAAGPPRLIFFSRIFVANFLSSGIFQSAQ